jgi:hypothetical protein
MIAMFTLMEVLQIAIGIMLMGFGVISLIVEDFSLMMITPTIGFFVLGGYLAYRGANQYFVRNTEEIQVNSTIEPTTPVKTGGFCTNCGEKIPEGTKFCTNCGQKA